MPETKTRPKRAASTTQKELEKRVAELEQDVAALKLLHNAFGWPPLDAFRPDKLN